MLHAIEQIIIQHAERDPEYQVDPRLLARDILADVHQRIVEMDALDELTQWIEEDPLAQTASGDSRSKPDPA